MRRGWRIAPVLVGMWLVAGSAVAQAPPDPRQMSGIPRVDPQTEPGTIVARVLRGSFNNPGVGLTVTLELKGAEGSETRTSVSDAQGRATFDINGFAGRTAVAKVAFEGEEVSSQAISVDPNVGVRVLLVQGAAAATAGPEATPEPEPAMPTGPVTPSAEGGPRPGWPFPNPGQPKGSIIVGALDLGNNQPFAGVEVRLEVTKPGAAAETRRVVTDARGAANFVGLTELPAGTIYAAEVEIGGALRKSVPFTLDGQDTGITVVLAGRSAGAPAGSSSRPSGPGSRQAGPEMGPQRRPVQPPRAVPTLPPGTVRTTVIGPDDAPIGGLSVAVVRQDIAGTTERFEGETEANGQARIEEVRVADDSLYRVEVTYKDVPFRSRLFQMTERMGVLLEVRVFPTTSDPSRVRSGVQFGIEAVENDLARVVQVYQLVVEGDEAYWPKTPLKIGGPEGSTGMVLLEDRVNVDLEHKEGAPFATLREPLPPGEVIDMSIAYLMSHRGSFEMDWTTPFPVATSRALVVPPVTVSGAMSGPKKPPHQEGQEPVEVEMYDLGEKRPGMALEFKVEGLITTSRVPRALGLGLGLAILLVTGLGMLLAPRGSLEQRLRRRQQVLLRALDRADAAIAAGTAGAAEERARVIGLLDQVFRQLDVVGGAASKHADPGAAWTKG